MAKERSPSVLWLSREIPNPPNSGDKVYTFRLAGALSDAGADVTAMGLSASNAACEHHDIWQSISDTPRSAASSVFSTLPLVAARYSTDRYVRAIRCELRRRHYDAVVIDNYGMKWVLTACKDLLEQSGSTIVHISHNFETELAAAIARDYRGNLLKKIYLYQNAVKTRFAERKLIAGSKLLVANTEEDAAEFVKAGARSEPLVLRPGYAGPRLSHRQITIHTPRRVVLLGSYAWIAKQINLAAFLEAADCRMAEAGIGIDVVGSVLPEFKAAWKGRLRATTFHGFVPDLASTLASVRIGVVAESTGGGFKHKTLDYIYSRVPVAGYQNALSGIPAVIQQHFILRDNPVQLTDAIIASIDNIPELNRMQNAAFAAAQDEFRWDVNGRKLLEAVGDSIRMPAG